jgi:hypothetical protein
MRDGEPFSVPTVSGRHDMADILIFHGLVGPDVFFVCVLLFFVALFSMMAIVGVVEAITGAIKEWAIQKRKRAFAPQSRRLRIQVFNHDLCLYDVSHVIPGETNTLTINLGGHK